MVRYISVATVLASIVICSTASEAVSVERQDFASEDVYELHRSNPSFRYCDINKDGAFQPKELPCYDRLRWEEPPVQVASTQRQVPSSTQTLHPKNSRLMDSPQERSRPAFLPGPASTEAIYEWQTPPIGTLFRAPPGDHRFLSELCEDKDKTILIRRSKPDIGNFADPICHADAIGAEFAWANNRVDENEVWSARGLIARPFTFGTETELPFPILKSVSLSPYMAFDRTSKAETIEELIDNLTYGAALEFGFANVLGGTQFFDIDGGLVSSFDGKGKNWGFSLAWEPKGDEGSNGSVMSLLGTTQNLGRYFTYKFSPTLQTGFASEISEAELQPLFADDDWALRSGPTVVFALAGTTKYGGPWWLDRLRYEITYGWLYDWVSGRDYELVDTSLNVGIDPSRHLGLTFSYRKGQLEETGQDVDLANIALSVSY